MQNVDIAIIINGRPVKQYGHLGKTFIEAKKGSNYSIKIKNNSNTRQLCICSVDGVDVISGQAATPDSVGYIINPYSSYTIQGFRVSDEKVNLFEFCEKGQSYAKVNPDTKNQNLDVGVIGIIVKPEKIKPSIINTYNSSCTRSMEIPMDLNHNIKMDGMVTNCVNMNYSSDIFDIGTKFSDKEIVDSVKEVTFTAENSYTLHEIFYASYDGLKSIGVPVENDSAYISFPQSFKNTYCKKPTK